MPYAFEKRHEHADRGSGAGNLGRPGLDTMVGEEASDRLNRSSSSTFQGTALWELRPDALAVVNFRTLTIDAWDVELSLSPCSCTTHS